MWQVGTSVSYAASDTVSMDVGYRFWDLSSSDTYQGYEETFFGAHEFSLGLRFGF